MKTRFSGTEIFRKYLWYLLRERSFDNDAVADMQQLKSALGLTDDEVTSQPAMRCIWVAACHAAGMMHTLAISTIMLGPRPLAKSR